MALSKLRFRSYKVLPLVYDDSLSYYEVLCKVVQKINEIIDIYTDIEEAVEEVRGYLDQLETMENNISTLITGLAELKQVVADNKEEAQNNLDKVQALLQQAIDDVQSNLDTKADELQKQINSNDVDITELGKKIDSNKELTDKDIEIINETLDSLQKQIDALDTVNKTYILQIQTWVQQELDSYREAVNVDIVDLQFRVKDIENRIKDLVAVDVWNYPLNQRVSLDVNNDQLYKDLGNALTEEQYASLGITAEEYAEKELNAMQYLRFSRDLLHYDWVYMPVSGVRQEVSNALTEIINYLWETTTAEGYAEAGLTAEEYAELGLDNNAYRKYVFAT